MHIQPEIRKKSFGCLRSCFLDRIDIEQGGKRQRFNDYAKAFGHAEKVATKLSNGERTDPQDSGHRSQLERMLK